MRTTKKLINTCRGIQTIFAIVSALTIIIMSSLYEPNVKVFLTMGVVFLVSVIIAALMSLIIDIATEYRYKQDYGKEEIEEDCDLPEVEEKVIQEKSARAVFFNYGKDGMPKLYERGGRTYGNSN